MRRTGTFVALVLASLAVSGCAEAPQPVTRPVPPAVTTSAEALNAVYEEYRADGLDRRQFDPADYWRLVERTLAADRDRFRTTDIGSSIEGRPLYRIDFGNGAIPVLLWTQMHGDESTASRSIVDIFRYLIDNADDPMVQRIESELALTFIPVLNPDGAARYVRQNAIGVDINRDARRLATPEGRTLKAVRDETNAQWGFNLHDQNIRTRRGRTSEDVQIALLAPPPGSGITNEANQNAKHLASLMVHALRPVVGPSIARYSETFNPRAFGDLMTQWGTATVLIEAGGRLDDPDKEIARRAKFVVILAALDAIATGAWEGVDQSSYADLPPNGRAVNDLLIIGGEIALPGAEPVRADVTVRFGDSLDQTGGVVQEVGDLNGYEALQVIDATGLYLVPMPPDDERGLGPALLPGDTLHGVLSRDRAGTQVVWRFEAGRLQRVEGR